MRWAGHVGLTGVSEIRYSHRIVCEKPLGRPRRKCEDSIKMDFVEMVWEGVDWIHLAQDRDRWRVLVNMVINFRFP
jgi:hypothetical protein